MCLVQVSLTRLVSSAFLTMPVGPAIVDFTWHLIEHDGGLESDKTNEAAPSSTGRSAEKVSVSCQFLVQSNEIQYEGERWCHVAQVLSLLHSSPTQRWYRFIHVHSHNSEISRNI